VGSARFGTTLIAIAFGARLPGTARTDEPNSTWNVLSMFDDESTRVLVRAALELALHERHDVQIALRTFEGTDRPKRAGVVVAILNDDPEHVLVSLRTVSGDISMIPLESIYGVRRA
jgi:hypothetical protein